MNFLYGEPMKIEAIDQRSHYFFHFDKGDTSVLMATVGERRDIIAMGSRRCELCDEPPQWEQAKDGNIRAATACAWASNKPFTMVVNFPSGAIVMADSLDARIPQPETTANYNSIRGQFDFVKLMESMNIAYGPVLNTSPSVFLDEKTGDLVIASLDFDGETDEPIVEDQWRHLGNICTDLWAYSIMDKEEYLSHELVEGVTEEYVEYAAVPAGKYEFTHFASSLGFDPDAAGTIIFARASKIS